MIASFAAVNTLADGLAGKSFIDSAYAFTAPAFAIIPAVLNVKSPNAFIGANGSVLPPSNPMIASFAAVNTLADGLAGKSFIASA